MNAERLNAIALALRSELDSRNVTGHLETLVNAAQQLSQNPGNTNLQQNYAQARNNLLAALANSPSDLFTPAWRQVLVELGGDELFGKKLRARVDRILMENQPTLSVAHQQLNEILTKLRTFRDSLTRLTDALKEFRVGAETLAAGEAEIAFLIPREAVHDKLDEFIGELKKIERALNTFSEAATGQIDDLKIRTISSSGLMVFLKASPKLAEIAAKCIDFIVEQYKRILEIRKLRDESERLGMPEISEKMVEYAKGLMKSEIDCFAVEIMAEYPAVDGGRKNELTTKMKLALTVVADRVDRGFSFEVKIEPPKAASNDPAEAAAISKAVQTIQSATANMQYIRAAGPPILSLRASSESAQEKKPDRQAPRKTRKRKQERPAQPSQEHQN